MPFESDAQRKAMYAAAAGHSTLGISKEGAKKFIGHSHDDASDMSRMDWKGLLCGLFKFLREEAEEPEHQEALDALTRGAAGVMFADPEGKALFVKRRSQDGDHDGEWAFPGGWSEEGEEPEDTARREAKEEVGGGAPTDGSLGPVASTTSPEGVQYTTFYQPVAGPFGVELSEESYAHAWASLEEPPEPLHPGVRGLLDTLAKSKGEDATLEPIKTGLHDKVRLALKSPLLSYTTKQLDVDPSPKVETTSKSGAYDALLREARTAELRGRGDLARRADVRLRALFAVDTKFAEVDRTVRAEASDQVALAAWVRRRAPRLASDEQKRDEHGQFAAGEGYTEVAHTAEGQPWQWTKKVATHKNGTEHVSHVTHAGEPKQFIARRTFRKAGMTGARVDTGKFNSFKEAHEANIKAVNNLPSAKDNQPVLATAPNSALPLAVISNKLKQASDSQMAMDWSGRAQRRVEPDAMKLALDRDTVRDKGPDGQLYVETSPISKANVCDYWGEEIPDWEKHGLDPKRKYRLLRAPDELRKATRSFDNLPILSEHVPVTSTSFPQGKVIGSTGTDAKFDGTYLKNSLVFWPQSAIDDIESSKKKELSSGYRYRYDPTAGDYNGQHYDGVMRDIVGNHVALVPEGRAGHDVVVGDSQIEENEMTVKVLSPRAVVARGALMVYMRPRLAADAQISYGPMLDGVTAKNFGGRKATIAAALRTAVAGKLAADADVEDVEEVLDAIESFKDDIVEAVETQTDNMVPPDDDQQQPPPDEEKDEANDSPEMLAQVLEFLKGKLSPEDMNQLTEMIGHEEQITEAPDDEAARMAKENEEAHDDVEEVPLKDKDVTGAMDATIRKARAGLVTLTAMDSAIKAAVDKTRAEMATQAQEVQEATRAIRPYVGELAMDASLDTADKIYAKALSVLGVPSVDKIHPSAYPALLSAQPRLGSRQQRHAQDAAPAGVKSFAERFPNAARVQAV